ncbi:MAG: hypothetical protein C4318_07090 [Acidimicrobiia bacterium]
MLLQLGVNYAIVGAYANAFGLAGYAEVVSEIRRRWDAGDRKGALDSVPLEICTDLACFGSAEDVASRVRQYLDAGAEVSAIHARYGAFCFECCPGG